VIRRAMYAAERKLVADHVRFARTVVRCFVKKRPAICHLFDDLLSAAHEGLCLAAMRFDPNRGLAFTTWSSFAMRDRMIDLLRGDRTGAKQSDAGPPVPLDRSMLATLSVEPNRRAEALEDLGSIASMSGTYPAFAAALADGDSLTEAAARIGVTKSWACRMRQKMAERLAA